MATWDLRASYYRNSLILIKADRIFYFIRQRLFLKPNSLLYAIAREMSLNVRVA